MLPPLDQYSFHVEKRQQIDDKKACNFTKSNTPPWVFFTFVKCTNGTKSQKTLQYLNRNILHIFLHTLLISFRLALTA